MMDMGVTEAHVAQGSLYHFDCQYSALQSGPA
jgi:hypothetical protein